MTPGEALRRPHLGGGGLVHAHQPQPRGPPLLEGRLPGERPQPDGRPVEVLGARLDERRGDADRRCRTEGGLHGPATTGSAEVREVGQGHHGRCEPLAQPSIPSSEPPGEGPGSSIRFQGVHRFFHVRRSLVSVDLSVSGDSFP